MASHSAIEWTEETWNPVRGCSRVSPGCDHCYAMRVAHRFSGKGKPYEGLTRRGDWSGNVRFVHTKLGEPFRWRKPRHVFVNSMGDLFHSKLSDEQIAAVFGVMAACPRHTFQVLTKRPGRMVEWFQWMRRMGDDRAWQWARVCMLRHVEPPDDRYGPQTATPWPLPNVWLGVTAEDQQRADERIPLLLQTPAAVRFVSVEPMLGAVWLPGQLYGLHWVIAGCESGPGARFADTQWFKHLAYQCQAAGVPFFLKQMRLGAGKLVKMPELDGRVWDQMPDGR